MSTTEISRTAVQVLEGTFRRRLSAKDDSSAAVIAEELLREVMLTEVDHTPQMIAVAKKAQELLPIITDSSVFPATFDVLWKALVAGWLQEGKALTLDEEANLARSISSESVEYNSERIKKLALARIREGLNVIDPHVAYHKVVRFLQMVDVENDSREIIYVMARSLGHYVPIREIVFVAHVLDAIPRDGGCTLESLGLAAPVVAQAANRLHTVALDALALAKELKGIDGDWPECELRDEHIVAFTWKISYPREDEAAKKAIDAILDRHIRQARKVVEQRRARGGSCSDYAVILSYTNSENFLRSLAFNRAGMWVGE